MGEVGGDDEDVLGGGEVGAEEVTVAALGGGRGGADEDGDYWGKRGVVGECAVWGE